MIVEDKTFNALGIKLMKKKNYVPEKFRIYVLCISWRRLRMCYSDFCMCIQNICFISFFMMIMCIDAVRQFY